MRVVVFSCESRVLARVYSSKRGRKGENKGEKDQKEDHVFSGSGVVEVWSPQMLELMTRLQTASRGRMSIQINKVSEEKMSRLLAETHVVTEEVVAEAPASTSSSSSSSIIFTNSQQTDNKKSFKVKPYDQVRQEQAEVKHLADWFINVRFNGDTSMPQGVRSFRIDDRVCLPHNEKHRKVILDKIGDVEQDTTISLNFQSAGGKRIHHYSITANSLQNSLTVCTITISYFTGPKDQPAQFDYKYGVTRTSVGDCCESSSDWATQMEAKRAVYSAVLQSFSGHD
jgi:hypothetical protein